MQKENVDLTTVKFSIGAKLIILISIIVIVSLGSITALVSWLIYGDLRVSAEEHNFETNRRSAMEAEIIISNVRAHSRILIRTITSAGQNTDAFTQDAVEYFFLENPGIASVFVFHGSDTQLLVNSSFFSSNEIDPELVQSYFDSQRNSLLRVIRGETLLLNAAPHFSRAVLALFYPLQDGRAGGVLFSSESLNQNFGFGTNQSYMINNDGDILSHADFSLVRDAVNLKQEDFIISILDSPQRSRQELVESDFKLLRSEGSPVTRNFFLKTWDNLRRNQGQQRESAEVIRKFIAFTKLNTAGVTVITGIEYDKVFEGIAATTRRNIYLTIAILCISVIFIWLFSKTISIPLKALAGVARNIEGGDFAMELKPKGNDEIGVLTNSFAKMCSALHIFGRFTNKEIAVKAMRGEIKPGGLPKHATIFFSDIREFTAKSENFTNSFGKDAPDKIVHWLNHYFTAMVDCVEKTNGVVDKFIGDAVMAHWGTAYSAGNPRMDAYNCVKGALMMRNALYEMNQQRAPDDPANPNIMIGCGINTGIVTAGQLGSDMRMEYTVIGDPVNLASRIEALTKPLGADILISEDTYSLVNDLFITEEMPSVTVKGKEKPVRIFAVVNATGVDKGPQTMADVRKLLGIKEPKLSKVDLNADEKKYKIGSDS
ncbi:MAG: adenylate/guanylate cyclase domain-containing protein [Treponema sp.]|nr:adenylate/guanylate cyclase domain-containing protein [Treponema sp.]